MPETHDAAGMDTTVIVVEQHFWFEATGLKWLTGRSCLINRIRTQNGGQSRYQARCGAMVFGAVRPAEDAPPCPRCWREVKALLVLSERDTWPSWGRHLVRNPRKGMWP